MKETNDVLNMFTSGLSAILNVTIAIQVLVYWSNTKNYDELELKELGSSNINNKDDIEVLDESDLHSRKSSSINSRKTQ